MGRVGEGVDDSYYDSVEVISEVGQGMFIYC